MIEAEVIDEAAKGHQSYINGVEKRGAVLRALTEPIKRHGNVVDYLALGALGASIYLFCTDRKDLAWYVGLGPVALLALKTVAEHSPAPHHYYE